MVLAAATFAPGATAQTQSLQAWRPDESFEVYAVGINYPRPFDRTYTGYGIYLGQGAVLTAAHVVGRRDLLVNPIVRIAGQELSAKVLKQGSFPQIDLALLSVDETQVPLKLRMRPNTQLCTVIPKIGTNVVVAYPDRTVRSQIISPALIGNLADRQKFNTLISDVQGSGSGAFDPEHKCLLGIMSASVRIHSYRQLAGHAGYFVPAARIALIRS